MDLDKAVILNWIWKYYVLLPIVSKLKQNLSRGSRSDLGCAVDPE
jgi:hypothetical protein